ncbi:MAG: dienelactone hydrolase family protein [Planctomycetota bacterium]
MHEPSAGALFALYDEYCHSQMSRRDFLNRATALGAAVGLASLAGCKAEELLPDYERTAQVSFTDERIKATFVEYDSPGGNSGTMRGYLVTPAQPEGPFGAVLVVHENRGLNPYVQDVARRAAVAGFLALAPDALFPVGGYPGNDEDGKVLQKQLDRDKIHVDMLNSARFLKSHAASNGKLGVTGFCFGGGVSNYLAVEMGDQLQAAAPFYGRAPDLARVGGIRAELAIHWAENDPRVNEHKPAYEEALVEAGVKHESYWYPGTRHGFHNDSTPRFDRDAADLAWSRTVDLFRRTLA